MPLRRREGVEVKVTASNARFVNVWDFIFTPLH